MEYILVMVGGGFKERGGEGFQCWQVDYIHYLGAASPSLWRERRGESVWKYKHLPMFS